MPHNKLAVKSQWLKTATVYTSSMIYVQHGSTVGWYFAYQNDSGLRLLGASPSGECWWQWRRAWRFAHGLFTISAHISLVRTSLTAPPKCKGFGKCEGADGMFGEYHCLIRAVMISAGNLVSGWFRTLHIEGIQSAGEEMKDLTECLGKIRSSARIFKGWFFLWLINIHVSNQLFFGWKGDFQLNKSGRQALLWSSFPLERCSRLLWICLSKQ